MTLAHTPERKKYSCSPIRQGKHLFYSLTIPSDVLAYTSTASRRHEDSTNGFQRYLDEKRAQEIADHIDSGNSIPTAIVLSAQKVAQIEIDRRKTLTFSYAPKAFFILDGQHRIFGFEKLRNTIRIPVVIYTNLSLEEETKIFIDLNTKQKPVPNELLLDIKQLTGRETDIEVKMRGIFDYFHEEPSSPLLGLMSPYEKSKGKLSRVTFNDSLKSIISIFREREEYEVYEILATYISSLIYGYEGQNKKIDITKPRIFNAFLSLFPEIGAKIVDRYGGNHTIENYSSIMKPIFINTKQSKLTNPGTSYKDLSEYLLGLLKNSISI